jgi:hypothetical protein
MSPVGGLRARLIKDNLFNLIEDSLEAIGWMDSGRQHADVTVVPEPLDNLTEITPNKVGIDFKTILETEVEMGSNMAENMWLVFVDVMAENYDIGLHLATDVKDIITGHFDSIGREAPTLTVLDLTLATPTAFTTCHVSDFEMEKDASDAEHKKYWWTCAFNLEDTYTNETG